MAVNYYIKFPGIIGGSKDSVHLGWFEVDSWLVDFSGGGKAVMDRFRFWISDGENPSELAEGVRSGRHLGDVTFDYTRSDGSLAARIEFKDAVLTSFTYGFELNFASYRTIHFDPLMHEPAHGRAK